MGSREIVLWLDRRWYDALSSQLEKEGMTVEEKLDEYLDAMVGQLPEREREEISREIREEEQAAEDARQSRDTASAGRLSAGQITFADEISEIDGKLNFYIDTGFDVDAVFGTHVCTGENDDCLNVYADYDMAAGQVCGELEVDLHRADGREESVPYTLNAVEKAMLLGKMEAYCLEQTGMTLKDYSAQLMAESAETVRPLSAFRVTQDGRTDHLLAEGGAAMDTLHAALRLRAYLIEKGDGSQRFAEALPAVDHILPEVFPDYADELRQGVGRVTTALDIDLDRGTFSTLAGADGWQTYRISDVCLAAWQATLPNQAEWEERRSVFAEHLQDKLVEQEAHSMVPPSGPAM